MKVSGPADSEYWNRVHARSRARESAVWRRHSDAVNAALLNRWLPCSIAGRVLKTDLFDEALSEGLAPAVGLRSPFVVGVDLSPSVASEAARHHREVSALCGDVRRLPFADAAFDAVISNSTLDHLSSARELECAIGEIARVLRPGGTLIITMDNPSHPLIRLRNSRLGSLFHRIGLAPYYGGYTIGIARLSECLRRAGLEVSDRTAIMHCPRVVAVPLARLLGHRSPKFQLRFLKSLMAFESLGRLATRFRTGHFVAARAVRAGGNAADI